jgi:hypothetical protein
MTGSDRRLALVSIPCVLLFLGCATRLVQLEPDRVLPSRVEPAERVLEVISSAAGGADPLPISKTSLALDGVAHAIGEFVAAAVAPWAHRHRKSRPGGWQMNVELTQSQAEAWDGHLTVALETRITLRAKAGSEHLGQTSGYCKVSDRRAQAPARIAYRCMERLSRDIAGWLEGVRP